MSTPGLCLLSKISYAENPGAIVEITGGSKFEFFCEGFR